MICASIEWVRFPVSRKSHKSCAYPNAIQITLLFSQITTVLMRIIQDKENFEIINKPLSIVESSACCATIWRFNFLFCNFSKERHLRWLKIVKHTTIKCKINAFWLALKRVRHNINEWFDAHYYFKKCWFNSKIDKQSHTNLSIPTQ